MEQTIREIFPSARCSDCGNEDVAKQHCGPLVPGGERAFFCQSCWKARYDEMMTGAAPRPLGSEPRALPPQQTTN